MPSGVLSDPGVFDRQEGPRGVLSRQQLMGILARVGQMRNPLSYAQRAVPYLQSTQDPIDAWMAGKLSDAPAFQPTLGDAWSSTAQNLDQTAGQFMRDVSGGDIQAAMNNPFFPLAGMTVYHGSPHKFDAFDLSKIGTGEGAQAYGHGLYFAENPGVAKQYRSTLAQPEWSEIPVSPELQQELQSTYADMLRVIGPNVTPADALDRVLEITKQGQKVAAQIGNFDKYTQLMDQHSQLYGARKQVAAIKQGGGLYNVDLPDEHIAKMLDWDKPLSEQPESVRKALTPILEKVADFRVQEAGKGFQVLHKGGWLTGQFPKTYKTEADARAALQKYMETEMHTRDIIPTNADEAKLFSDAGIPGLKYLDNGSRNAGGWHLTPPSETVSGKWMLKSSDYNSKGIHFDTEDAARAALKKKLDGETRNFVVFDDKIVKVLKRE
jgi:hypothetical protein